MRDVETERRAKVGGEKRNTERLKGRKLNNEDMGRLRSS